MIILKRILVPTDFSETSAAALTYGVAFAPAFDARLFVLHVAIDDEYEAIVESQRVVDDALGWVMPSIEPGAIVRHAAGELLAKALAPQDAEGVDVEYVLVDGGRRGAHAEIMNYAKEQDIDVIIMGTHGRGRMAHIVMAAPPSWSSAARRARCSPSATRSTSSSCPTPEARTSPRRRRRG